MTLIPVLVAIAFGFAQQAADIPARTRALIGQLTDPSALVRGEAKLQLKTAPHPDALPILLEALPAAAQTIQHSLIEVLAEYKDLRKLPALVRVSRSIRSQEIEEQFVSLGLPAAQALLEGTEPCRPSEFASREYASWVGSVLSQMKDDAVPALLVALAANNLCAQQAAGEALGGQFLQLEAAITIDDLDRSPLTLLIDSARHDNPRIRKAAQDWINGLTHKTLEPYEYSPFIEALIGTYQTSTRETMIEIASLLSKVGETRVLRFMRAATRAPAPEIKRIARDYIAEDARRSRREPPDEEPRHENNTAELSRYLRAANGRDPAARIAAADIIRSIIYDADSNGTKAVVSRRMGDIVSAFQRMLQDPDPQIVAAAAGAFDAVRDRDVTPILLPLATHADARVRLAAVSTLGSRGLPIAVEVACALVPRLRDQDADVRREAAAGVSAMFKSGSRCPGDADEVLVAFGDEAMRRHLYEPLARMKDPRAVPLLIADLDRIASDPIDRTLCAPCLALANLGDRSAVEPLLPYLRSSSVLVAAGVIEVLSKLGDPRAVPAIVLDLEYPHPRVRSAAITGLHSLQRCEAMPAIRPRLGDEDPWVRAEAARVAAACKDGASVDALMRTLPIEKEPREIARALGVIGDVRAVPALIAALSRFDCVRRLPVIEALGALRDPAATEPLLALLSQNRPGPSSCFDMDVIAALGDIGDPRAVPDLERLIKTSIYRSLATDAAEVALKKIKR